MNTVAMTVSIGGSFQWEDGVSLLQMTGILHKETRGSVLDTSLPKTMPSARAGLKRCPPPTPFFTGRKDILSQMHIYFSENLGRRHVFVLHGLGGAGKSQIAFQFVEECRLDAETNRYAPSLRRMLAIESVHSAYLGSQKYFSLM